MHQTRWEHWLSRRHKRKCIQWTRTTTAAAHSVCAAVVAECTHACMCIVQHEKCSILYYFYILLYLSVESKKLVLLLTNWKDRARDTEIEGGRRRARVECAQEENIHTHTHTNRELLKRFYWILRRFCICFFTSLLSLSSTFAFLWFFFFFLRSVLIRS